MLRRDELSGEVQIWKNGRWRRLIGGANTENPTMHPKHGYVGAVPIIKIV